jgi:hypothetical protein
MTASTSTSRLFHTIVVVGINLGASAGCGGLASGPGDAPANASSSSGGSSSGAAAPTGDAAPPDAVAAAFCDVAWPTTKGNNTVLTTPLPPCIDPGNACKEVRIDTVGPCLPVQADGCLVAPATFYYPNCRGGAWVCPPPTASSNATPAGTCACLGQFRGGARCADDGKGGGTWEKLP